MKLQKHLIAASISMVAFASADSVELKTGAIHNGELIGMEAGFVRLAIMDQQGDVEIRINPEDIANWDFEDSQKLSAQPPHQSLPLLQSAYDQRYPFFEYLPIEDQKIAIMLTKLHLEKGSFSKVLDQCKHLKLISLEREIEQSLGLLEMEAAWRAGDLSLARTLATLSIDAKITSDQSALPWTLLALYDYQSEDHESARLHSLHPIAFAKQNIPPYLEHCYAIAINASTQSGDTLHANLLKSEMNAKRLKWPTSIPRNSDLPKPAEAKPFTSDIKLKGTP
ncbi:MAG: hypothetical protein AAGB46_15680 [Verrucomicrobiota bacterium]